MQVIAEREKASRLLDRILIHTELAHGIVNEGTRQELSSTSVIYPFSSRHDFELRLRKVGRRADTLTIGNHR